MFLTDGMKAVVAAIDFNSKSEDETEGTHLSLVFSILSCESLGLMNTVSLVVGKALIISVRSNNFR